MCAKTLGELKYSLSTFANEAKGRLSVYEDGIEMDSPKKIMITKNYVSALERTAQKPMNKCEVRLDYFDIFGNKNSVEFVMYEEEFKTLKMFLQK
ncbi:MAG: hypothetical protein PHT59_07890 [Candidatus Omnitrophica bacterium]|nr:hypothetical protein [Candidatus Omnitrophota bacterium]